MIHLPTCPSDVIVLHETDPQATIWELLSEVARRLPTELAAVESCVDGERFLTPRWPCRRILDRQCVQGTAPALW